MANGGGNEPNLALIVAGLERDVQHLAKEIQRLETDQKDRFKERQEHVDRNFTDLKEWISKEFVPLNSFKPVTKWLTIIGISVITFLFTVIASIINFVITFFGNGKPPSPGAM